MLLQLGRLEEAMQVGGGGVGQGDTRHMKSPCVCLCVCVCVQAYDSSFRLSSALAQVNLAHVLELLGEEQAARRAFAEAIAAARNKSEAPSHTTAHPGT